MVSSRHLTIKSIAVFLLILSLPSQAEQARTGWTWGGYLEHLNLDNQAAQNADIKTTAYALGMEAEYYTASQPYTASAGFAYVRYNDAAGFRVRVQEQGGRQRDASSQADALQLYGEVGPRYVFAQQGATYFATPRLGVAGIFDSTRSVPNCSDCPKEGIDIDGGLYGLIGVGVVFDGFSLSLRYKQYVTGDINNSFGLMISTNF